MKPMQRNRGLTLVELLVSMSMGLVIVGAMAALYVRTSQSNRQLEALARLQENARYAFEIMGYDIRMAGNTGCYVPGQPSPTNLISNATDNWWSNMSRPLFGWDETPDSNAVGDANFPQIAPGNYGPNALRGDTLVVLRANGDDKPPRTVASYTLNSGNPITLKPKEGADDFSAGSLLVMSNCAKATVLFKLTRDGKVENDGSSPSADDMASARLLPLSANAYYLRASPYKYPKSSQYIPSLYRQTLTTNNGEIATTAEELVSGVTDLRIRYGLGTIDPDTGYSHVTSYVDATSITDPEVWTDHKTSNKVKVLAVRITLTLESSDDGVRGAAQTFKLGNGASVTDQRLRRSYTSTFRIRNRLEPIPTT